MANPFFRKKNIDQILADAKSGVGDTENFSLHKVLGVRDITFLGMAAIIGAGIFSTIGQACFDGGPAVILLFVFIAIACGFTALCYAEMASRIPVAGSAYTYTYATFGELIAWIIGWDLIMEYAVGNITVAISWSGNFVTFLKQIGVHLPQHICYSFLEVKNKHALHIENIANGIASNEYIIQMYQLWENAPKVFGIPLIFNLPAFIITVLITALVYIGIKESRKAANAMVVFKIVVVIAVIVIGFLYVQPSNWQPFAPNGFSGVLKGVSAVFFAYIGFDALATVAEECKNPQRDLPKGMIYSLIIATTLYILTALVLTGMVKYTELNNEAFLANAFLQKGINWVGGVIAFSALIATASVLLVFQIGQPRIWMSMSRDGLLPKKFATIHPKFKTPSFSTILTGFLVGVPALFLDAAFVTDMCSIGTLFAFALVCGGIIILHQKKDEIKPQFKLPNINGKFIIPVLFVVFCYFFFIIKNEDGSSYWQSIFSFSQGWEVWKHQIPMQLFVASFLIISILSFIKNYSLIPVLGLLCCLYLLSTLGLVNWIRFIIWLIIGIVIYLNYGKKHSLLQQKK